MHAHVLRASFLAEKGPTTMGLDITAYEKVTLIRSMTVQEYNEDENSQEEADGDGKTLLYQDGKRPQSDGLADGIYATSGKSRSLSAGSYSGYNAWRDMLARTMLGKTARDVWNLSDEQRVALPFTELINFSDCEGFIGPTTSAKLARDFAEHRARLPRKTDDDAQWFVQKYNEWAEAFALAAAGGVVKFH
jgi:hypothetical protein